MKVGEVKCGEEFICGGRTFKRVGPLLNGQRLRIECFDETYNRPFYSVRMLPYANSAGLKQKRAMGHQNAITVQEKETGAFFWMECSIVVEAIK